MRRLQVLRLVMRRNEEGWGIALDAVGSFIVWIIDNFSNALNAIKRMLQPWSKRF